MMSLLPALQCRDRHRATANLMDADPGIDRQHFSLVFQGKVRHRLSLAVWQLCGDLFESRLTANLVHHAARYPNHPVDCLDKMRRDLTMHFSASPQNSPRGASTRVKAGSAIVERKRRRLALAGLELAGRRWRTQFFASLLFGVSRPTSAPPRERD